MSAIIRIDDVSVSYRENIALRHISLSVDEGAFVSVIGPNGAGKTTLLTVINGLGTLLAGSVTVFGQSLRGANLAAIRKDIGYIPQHAHIDPRSPLSVRQAVSIGRFGRIGIGRSTTAADREAVESAMEATGIAGLADKPIGHLSGGEHQKVALARVLAQQPRIILLDEPTSNLDPRAQEEIMRLVERIFADKKYTMVFVTHILSHIPDCCDQVVLMKRGGIMHAGEAQTVLTAERLSALYDCTIEIGFMRGKRHFHAAGSHL